MAQSTLSGLPKALKSTRDQIMLELSALVLADDIDPTARLAHATRAEAIISLLKCDAARAVNASLWVNKLPPEIWLLVLRLLDQSTLITASLVCYSWRQQALADPSLWTDITYENVAARCSACQRWRGAHDLGARMDVPASDTRSSDIMRLPKLLAARAGHLPICLRLELSHHASQTTEVAICLLLCDPVFSSRIRSLQISYSGEYPGQIKSLLHALSAGDISNLRSVILRVSPRVPFGSNNPSINVSEECLLIAKAPLQRLVTYSPVRWTDEQIVYANLTHLESVFCDLPEIARALRLCPRLTHLDAKLLIDASHCDDGRDWTSLRQRLFTLHFLGLRSNGSAHPIRWILGPARVPAGRIPILVLHISAYGNDNILLDLVQCLRSVASQGTAMEMVGLTIGSQYTETERNSYSRNWRAFTVESRDRKFSVVVPADAYAAYIGAVLGILYSTLATYSLTSLRLPWETLKDNLCAAPAERLARITRLSIDFAIQNDSEVDDYYYWQFITGWEDTDDPTGPQAVISELGYPGEAPHLPALQHLVLQTDLASGWEFSFAAIDALVERLTFGTVAPLLTLHLEGLNLSEWSDKECRMAQHWARRVSGIRDPDASWR